MSQIGRFSCIAQVNDQLLLLLLYENVKWDKENKTIYITLNYNDTIINLQLFFFFENDFMKLDIILLMY